MASVEVRSAGLDEARKVLARLEAASGVPPVDEDEERRLAGVAPIRDHDWRWGSHLALVGTATVAYAGIRLPPTVPSDPSACVARVDLALDRSHPDATAALVAALDDARDHAQRRAGDAKKNDEHDSHGVDGAPGRGRVQAWLREATEADLAAAGRAGFTLVKRLHVMAMPLGAPAGGGELPDGLRIRSFEADGSDDADAVVALLAAAYPNSEGGWDAPGFAGRRATDWFRAEDLLLLEDERSDDAPAGRLLGVHWTKRRGEGVGEVHNLALGPAARGQGFGGLLLDVGLAHLADAGCHEAILWVDADNTPALGLYRSRGFVPRWDDVALIG